MLEVLLAINQLGCDFLVAGRKVDGSFKARLQDFDSPFLKLQLFSSIITTLESILYLSLP